MRNSPSSPRLLVTSLALLCLAAVAWSSRAAEESQKFLEGIRKKGLYDMALEYLDQMRNSPQASEDFKTVIDYEAGVTLIEAAGTERSMTLREEQWSEAREKFEKFRAEHPKHPLATNAGIRITDLLVERGRMKKEQANSRKKTPQEKQQLLQEARSLYQKAQELYVKLDDQFLKAHRALKMIDKKDTKLVETRNRVRGNLVQTRLNLGTVVYEISQTYEPGSAENKKLLEQAAAKYGEVYDKYGGYLGGDYARMWQGRCFKELERTKEAFEAFEDVVLIENDSPGYRRLKNKARVLGLETALLPKVKKYEEGVTGVLAWEKAARPDEEDSPEGLAMKFLGGEAAWKLAESLKDDKKQVKKRQENLKTARRLFTFVKRFPGQYQKLAKLRLAEMSGGEELVPTAFTEALDAARELLGQLEEPDLPADEVAQLQAEALKYLRLALTLATTETKPEDLNEARFFLAYLYYVTDDLYRSAVIGEFLARRYPNDLKARDCAKIAMASYMKLHQDAGPEADRQFERRRMLGIAEYITRRWADDPESDRAWLTLVRNALESSDIPAAMDYLKRIPAGSPRRGEATLMVGRVLWKDYATWATRLHKAEHPIWMGRFFCLWPRAQVQSAFALWRAEVDGKRRLATQVITEGVQEYRKLIEQGTEVPYSLASAVFSLAHISFTSGDAKKAVEWLEDPQIGIVTLLKKNHPATEQEGFAVEACKLALQAYCAEYKLAEVEQVMPKLEELVNNSGDAEAGKDLTRFYFKLARQLNDQLEELRRENRRAENEETTAKISRLWQGLEGFLARIVQREEGITLGSLYWAAQTFFEWAQAFDPDPYEGSLPPKAEGYYKEAEKAYRKIRDLAEKEKIEATAGVIAGVKVKLAACLCRLGDRENAGQEKDEAMSLLLDVLEEREQMIDAQVQAAYVYQSWGRGDPGYYKLAYAGSEKHKQVWGWGKIAIKVQRKARQDKTGRYRSIFHEARYNLAWCRFQLAQKGETTLELAEKDILVVQRLYPEMGGEKWYPKYDRLLRQIQDLAGQQPLGLKATAGEEETASQ